MSVRRGEIYWVEFDPVKGSEQGGLRPALIIQNDLGNRSSPTTIVAAMSRTVPPHPYPFVVIVTPDESGLRDTSTVNCAQLATVQQSGEASRFRPPRGGTTAGPIGRLSADVMRRVDEALRASLEIA